MKRTFQDVVVPKEDTMLIGTEDLVGSFRSKSNMHLWLTQHQQMLFPPLKSTPIRKTFSQMYDL
jgi:hypothetical protein